MVCACLQVGYAVVIDQLQDKSPSGHGMRMRVTNPSGTRSQSSHLPDTNQCGRVLLALGLLMGVFTQEKLHAMRVGDTMKCRPSCDDWYVVRCCAYACAVHACALDLVRNVISNMLTAIAARGVCRYVMCADSGCVLHPTWPLSPDAIGQRFQQCGACADVHLTTRMMRTGLCLDNVLDARLFKNMVPDFSLIADIGGWKACTGPSGAVARDYHVPMLVLGNMGHMVRCLPAADNMMLGDYCATQCVPQLLSGWLVCALYS